MSYLMKSLVAFILISAAVIVGVDGRAAFGSEVWRREVCTESESDWDWGTVKKPEVRLQYSSRFLLFFDNFFDIKFRSRRCR